MRGKVPTGYSHPRAPKEGCCVFRKMNTILSSQPPNHTIALPTIDREEPKSVHIRRTSKHHLLHARLRGRDHKASQITKARPKGYGVARHSSGHEACQANNRIYHKIKKDTTNTMLVGFVSI